MNYKSIQNRFNVKAFFEKRTNIDFYNLFQPVIPSIDLTGKIAQCISAVTEAVTIWFICQSELSGINKIVSIVLTITAIILTVTAIELGGRKGLQVLTRAIVWKRLVNGWYWILFLFVLGITGTLFYQSFQLSTKGISQSFKQSVEPVATINDDVFFTRHQYFNDQINEKYDKQLATIINANSKNKEAKEAEYNSKVLAIENLIKTHTRNRNNGVKWAQSHIDKQTKIRDATKTEKAAALALITTIHNENINSLEANRVNELEKESDRHLKAVGTAEKKLNIGQQNKTDNANFWGSLFSNLVGLMIFIAFVCIVVVEIFRKGAGIEINYHENELPPSLLAVGIAGINNRLFNVSYKWVSKLYVHKKVFDFNYLENDGRTDRRKIGFITSSEKETDAPHENRITGKIENRVIEVQKEFVRKCDHCNKDFTPNHKKHRFCTSDCRKRAWENKTGKELKYRSKKN